MAVWPEVPGYRIIAEIGRGGFAMVYRAEQLDLGREVALKVLSVLDMTDDEVSRFERECATLARLDWHPNILRILHTGMTDEGRPYLAMELLEQGSLAGRQPAAPMPIDDVAEIGVQISAALTAAHAEGVLHRDVKPANILIDRTGRYRLADFGIASIVGTSRSSSAGMAGTVGYLPPEIILGKKATAQSDVYSLGATMHALVTGAPPFARPTDESSAAAMSRTLTEPASDLRDHGAPEWFAAAIARSLDKDPGRRYATAEAFGQALLERSATMPASPSQAPGEAVTTRRAGGTAMSDTPKAESPTEALADDTVRVRRWPAAPAIEQRPGRSRRPLVIAAVIALAGTVGGVTYAASQRSDDTTSATSADTVSPASPATTEVTAQAPVDATIPPVEATVATIGSEAAATSLAPRTESAPSTAPSQTLPVSPPGTTTTVPARRPSVTTTIVASQPPIPAATVATTPAPAPAATIVPVITAAPVTTPTPAPVPVTTAPPAPATPALTVSAVTQSPSPDTPGQYFLANSVSDLCVTVVWRIPSIDRVHAPTTPSNCWTSYSGGFDTGWHNNENNIPPSGSHPGTLTVTNRAGVSITRSFTLVVL